MKAISMSKQKSAGMVTSDWGMWDFNRANTKKTRIICIFKILEYSTTNLFIWELDD